MKLVVKTVVMMCTVWLVEGARSRTAQIAATLMDSSTGITFNTSYFFGIYGASSTSDPVSGHLVHVRSEGDVNHGCRDYNHDLPTHDWVALIERGSCYFTDKVRVATKRYNASAVIVYDNRPSRTLVAMRSSVTDEVYLFVKQSFGRRLAIYADDPGLHVHVNITSTGISAGNSAANTAFPVGLCWAVLMTGFGLVWL